MSKNKKKNNVFSFYQSFSDEIEESLNEDEKLKRILKLNLYLDCMPLDDLPTLSDDDKNIVRLLVTRNDRHTFSDEKISKVFDEVDVSYSRVMCRLAWHNLFPKLNTDQVFIKQPSQIQTGMLNFQEVNKYIHWKIIYIHPEVYNAVCQIIGNSQELSNKCLFEVNFVKSTVSLDDFECQQKKALNMMMKYLNTNWLNNVVKIIKTSFNKIGKGCFDLNQNIPYVYDVIKLKRFICLNIFIMQSILRTLVLDSLNKYLTLLETPTVSIMNVHPDFVWGNNLVDTQFPSAMNPIFRIELQIDAHGGIYLTDLLNFKKIIIECLDDAVIKSHYIKQVQPFLLQDLKFSPSLYLSSIGLLSEEVCQTRDRLKAAYKKSLIPLEAYAKEYNKYLDLYILDVTEYIGSMRQEGISTLKIQEEISFQYASMQELKTNIPDKIIIGPFEVYIEILKNNLIDKRKFMANCLLNLLTENFKNRMNNIIFKYDSMHQRLRDDPPDIEGIVETREYMDVVPTNVAEINEIFEQLRREYDVLDSFKWNIPDEDFQLKWICVGYPLKIEHQLVKTSERLSELSENYIKTQLIDELTLSEEIDKVSRYLIEISRQTDPEKIHNIASDVKKAWQELKMCKEQSFIFNERRRLFNMPMNTFHEHINSIEHQLEMYKILWCTASDWKKSHEAWLKNPLEDIDAEEVELTVNQMFQDAQRCTKIFENQPELQSIAVNMCNEIDKFKPHMSLLKSLRHHGIKAKHFEDLSTRTGIEISFTRALTLEGLLTLGIMDFKDDISDVSDIAQKEYTIESTLKKMMQEWQEIKMDIIDYKNTGTYIMKINEEILMMLDEHIINTQQISFSPFRDAVVDILDTWESKLKLTQEVLNEWINLQKSWMYLEAVFTSEDISRQLPVEAKKYTTMERNWRRIMKRAKENPHILQICPDKSLLESLKECISLLEIVQRGLSDYLETKRSLFPRFFFLSDDELLEILAQTKNVRAVQPHLTKCFENMKELKFEKDLEITKMYSSDGEEVSLKPTIYPIGNVENWLGQVEMVMRDTLRSIISEALQLVDTTERKTWVYMWPGQVVICAGQTHWTACVENAILKKTLNEYYTEMINQLSKLRELIKSHPSQVQRLMLEALIIIEVHARDVVELLKNKNVSTINDFNWISQLRYYWINEETNYNIKIRVVNAEFPYGYEYLGNNGRLVITTLTERCYLTLCGALHLKFGGAPAGPAGTGKTETTKDLAKAFAIQCVVFNCSDQLDYLSMGKFFKGLASAGAWACFDEFNRIDIEVLSVIAQQILTIQRAQQLRADRFLFEGYDIPLKSMCSIFITMNPGYAGRTELPDNLKALFRPVAMMVPNYSLIAEISLFSYGFINAKVLAIKITATFKLSSEQLSTQDHYDFGMRAVKSVIAFAGKLNRENNNLNENQICLRALMDVNVPKFLRDDLILFEGILSDLFPGVIQVEADNNLLKKSIHETMNKMKLKIVPDYVDKVMQLYETTTVRHGLMLVGATGSGKTKCYEILQNACTNLQGNLQSDGSPFVKINKFIINPKSISLGRLYGEFDLDTHEWTDGILPYIIRKDISLNNAEKKWYIFDGPVDALWIENLNTVLDDNKKLCLTSGEIIKLQTNQTIIFEVGDLKVASPATVSRCGMVYLDDELIGVDTLIDSWIESMPEETKKFSSKLSELTYQLFPAGLELLRRHLTEIVVTVNITMVHSYINLVNYQFSTSMASKGTSVSIEYSDKIFELLEGWILFAIIWSIGGSCDNSGRQKFDEWLRKMQNKYNYKFKIPQQGVVYDYRFDEGDSFDPPQWIKWLDDNLPIIISPSTKFADIEIPTLDTVRNSALIEYLLNSDKNVLCVGPTGSGKTLTISSKLTKGMPKKYTCNFMTFSAKTSASKTQSILESKLEKKRAGVYGASVLKKQIFFIDDLNMPLVEVYGAQPPLELLRQLFDSGGWYDSQDIGSFRQIVDVNILAAMGPPGGGRNFIDNRVLRHFHFITFPEMENNTKEIIFGAILNSWLIKTPNCHVFYDQILKSTINLFDKISHQLLPTPDKLHYTFNLRDLSRIFQGILMADPSKIYEKGDLLALWYHENTRIMGDRLVNTSDLSWFDNTLWSCLMDHFGDIRKDSVLGEGQLFYGDFCNSFGQYQRITDTQKMETILYDIMEEYNHSSDEPMKLVLFDEAMSHICRISRILRQPRGNALLLGVGGSGRQSLAKLSSFLCNKSCFQIESRRSYTINDWHDDIKSIMLKAGISSNSIVFLFSDTQIKDEVYLEDIHNILNSGDVPNIYQPDELDKIYQSMRSSVQEAGLPINKTNLYNYYLKNLQNNLHTVLAMSPIGDAFRGYIRQFPALINCCVIDWFHPWSDKALQSVAVRFIKDIDDVQIANDTLQQIVNTCQFMHSSTINICEEFYQLLNRRNYVTPASYLEMLANYGKLLCSRKKELLSGIERLSGGLGKLSTTEIEVKQMQLMLIKMKPELESSEKSTFQMIEKIQNETIQAEATKTIAKKQENDAAILKIQNQEIKNEAEKDLRQVKPMLHAAEASLKALNKNDIIEVKTMKRPPPGVVLVIEAVCIVKEIKPIKIPGKIPGEKVLDYWTPGSHLLSDPGHFLKDLTNFDKNKITEDMINKLKIYINNPSFEPDKIMFVSKACYSLCLWLHAMYNYYFVNKKIQPKMLALKTAELTLLETEKNLLIAMEKLHEVEDNIDKLKQQLNNEEIKLSKLKDDKKLCEDRMLRAVRLIDGLDDEKKRWIQNVGDIKINYDNCIGDCLIASGSIAYLSPFIDSYRLRLLHYWMNNLGDKVPHSFDCSPVSILGDTVKIRNWQIDGLPRDVYSIENAILVENSRRWPLFIDPQSQANKWIKKSRKITGLSIVRLSDKDLIRIIENCVRFGRACLIENINNELDNALDSILTKNFFYHAGKLSIKIGDNVVVYDQRFRLYITTQLSNPHYSPEIFAKLLIVNFSLTSSGLLDQMLSIVVMEERPDLEATRSELIVSCAQMKNDLKNIENRILDRLTTSEGSAIDDIDLINTLEASKFKSQEIKLKVDISEKTQIDIDNTRLYYLPVANRAQLLFFSINDLRFIDFMYQYSLEWFINIFITSVSKTEKSDDIEKRVNLINENLTYFLFTNVCRSLFEKHKLHLALLICARIKINSNTIESNEWRHFLAGETPSQEKQNPAKTWLSDRAWQELQSLEIKLPRFKNFTMLFKNNLNIFKYIYDDKQPENNSHFVDKFNYDDFQKLLLIKCLRPDRLINAIQIYVSKYLGSKFIEPQTTELSIIHKESSSTVPIVFILSSGTDPAAELFKYAEKIGMAKKLETISLGQGQGPRAELMLQQSVENGNWVFFQNCHLAPSWMPKLENLVESFPDNTHKGFRLWLTSTPTTNFPSSILENSIKLTVEPPRGIKANMMRAYVNQVAEMQDIFKSENIKTQNFKSLLFSLCLFHSVLLERRKFGSLGFNIPYEFSEGDLKICISQLYMFVMEYPSIPFEVLTYTAGQINYGGRITDDWDRRCIMTILHDYYKKESLVSGYKFDPNGHYCQLSTDQPDTCTLFEYLEYIRTLPLNDDPSIFGLDMNADISYASAEAYSCLDTLLMLQPKIIDDSSINVNENTVLLVENIINKIPQLFNIEDIQKKYPVLYEESFNTVIQQEAKRYNSLIKILSINLSDLLKALKGQTTMTEQLESTSDSLFNSKVPKLWLNRGYPSLKPLGAWIIDFVERINFMKRWISSGIPAAFWISGFYFPQAFITGTLQNYARKYKLSIDQIDFSFKVLNNIPTSKPKDGCVVYGLFLEGCRWNGISLDVSQPKELYTEMKPILLLPVMNTAIDEQGYYDCPVYKTLTRSGTLSTTGHSTNFVLSMKIPSRESQSFWIKRGVALICALDY